MFNLINRGTGLCADGTFIEPGCPLKQWPLHGGSNQRWRLELEETTCLARIGCGSLYIEPNGTVHNTKLMLNEKNDTSLQLWRINEVEPGWYQIHSEGAIGLVLTADRSMKQGEILRLCTHDKQDAFQLWRLSLAAPKQFPYLTKPELDAVSVRADELLAAPERALKIMSDEGYLVINDVLSVSDLSNAEAAFGRDLRNVLDTTESGHSKNVLEAINLVSTAEDQEIPKLWPGGYSTPTLAISHGLPQGEFSWFTRLHATVRAIYARLHDVPAEELVVGMDTPFFKPVHSEVVDRTEIWGHADLNTVLGASRCVADGIEDFATWVIYQSILSVWPSVDNSDSTTVIWPRSHLKIFPILMQHPSTLKWGHFVPIEMLRSCGPKGEWINERYLREARRIPLQPGAMIVWNSRTFHQGWTEGKRLAMPICWEPKSRRTQQAYARKVRHCVSGAVTTHWASLGTEHPLPRRMGKVNAKDDPRGAEWVELPTQAWTKLYCLRDDVVVDMEFLQSLCSILKRSFDLDVLAQLETFLKPEVLAVL